MCHTAQQHCVSWCLMVSHGARHNNPDLCHTILEDIIYMQAYNSDLHVHVGISTCRPTYLPCACMYSYVYIYPVYIIVCTYTCTYLVCIFRSTCITMGDRCFSLSFLPCSVLVHYNNASLHHVRLSVLYYYEHTA